MSWGLNIFGIITRIAPITFLFIREDKFLEYFNWFKKIFVLTTLLSLISYSIIVFFNIQLKHNYIAPLNTLKNFDYVQYPFLVSSGLLGINQLNVRFSGMFDEPGVIGSIVTILLFADNYNLKSKQNIILFIAGILSFSFYFIISSLVYFLYISNIKIRLIVIILFLFSYLTTKDNPIVTILVWDRFIYEDGQLKGDNRAHEDLQSTYEVFINSNDVLFGKGANYAKANNLMGSSSYKSLILNYGAVFFISICLSFGLLAFFTIKKYKYVIGYLFLFGGMIYQRPGLIYDPTLFFLLIAIMYSFKQESKKKLIYANQ